MLTIIKINPSSDDWSLYLIKSSEYLKENWPEYYKDDLDKIITDYGEQLLERLKEGSRGLFLFKDGYDVIGGANVYILEDKERILNIAEFFIEKKLRNKGFGKKLYKEIIRWGVEEGCSKIFLEVDKDKSESNLFWKSLGLKCDDMGKRNLYTGVLSG